MPDSRQSEFGLVSLKDLYRKSHAVIIGISNYKEPDLKLNNAVNDARDMAIILEEKYGFEKENIKVLLNEEATRATLADLFENYLGSSEISNQDRLLVYYSGHGTIRLRTDPSGKSAEQSYLIPQDATPGKYDTYYDLDVIRSSCAFCSAKHILIVFDSCFSGTLFARVRNLEGPDAGATDDKFLAWNMAKKAIQAIAATDKNQVALDDNMNQNTMQNGDGAHHGAFTGYLLDYLNNPNVLDQNGILTATQVGSYLQKAVPRGQISQNPVYGPLYGTEGAEFIFQIFAQSKTNSIDDQPVNQPLSDLLRAEDVEQFNLLRGEAPNLAKQSFRRRNLEHANFKNAILCDVNLSEADAKGADFSGADLSDACLDFADLRTAEFKGSVLEKASFQFALLSGAKNLERAGLDPQSFDGANFDSPEVDGDAQTHSGIASFFDLKSAPAKYVEVGSYKTRYLDYPRPICENKTAQEPIPTVLLHGLLGSADTWLLMTNSLSKYLRLIVPDIIGSGDSDKPNVKYDLEFFMKFLSDFFASLSIGKANIVAMSVGARQAIEFTLRFPSLVNKLVLCSPQILYPGFPIDGVINAVTSMDGPALMKALIQGTNVNDYYARDIDAGKAVRSSVDYFVQNIQQPELRHSYASTLCELQNYPALPGRLSKISVPTLLVWGEEDSMSPISYAAQFNEIPNLQYLKMEDCGHAIPLEKPLELSKAILKFLLNLG